MLATWEPWPEGHARNTCLETRARRGHGSDCIVGSGPGTLQDHFGSVVRDLVIVERSYALAEVRAGRRRVKGRPSLARANISRSA